MQQTKKDNISLIKKLSLEIQAFYKNKKYLETINLLNKVIKIEKKYSDYFNFDDFVTCYMFIALSYILLEQYNDALNLLESIENRYLKIKKANYIWNEIIRDENSEDNLKILAKQSIPLLNEQLRLFNKTQKFKFYSNLATTYYQLRDYDKSIQYYRKALYIDSKNIELNLGIAQAQYYKYKKKLPLEIKNNYLKTIQVFEKLDTSFDSLLALGKMYYFLGNYKNALIYVQNALDIETQTSNKKIYAYDWLSRIAYKEKNYGVAIHFYEEIIKCLVEKNIEESKSGIIHPIPKLHEMVKYLNENKQIVNKAELDLVNKTIWLGIITAFIFGIIENWSKLGFIGLFALIFIVGIICKYSKI